MKGILGVFITAVCVVQPVLGDSFLKPTSFPKTFQDLSFTARMNILREGYLPYEIQYDENGVCTANCAYHGITLDDDMRSVDQATDEMADLIANSGGGSSSSGGVSSSGGTAGTSGGGGSSGGTNGSSGNGSFGGGSSGGGGYSGSWGNGDWCRNGLSTKLPLRYPVDMTNFKYKISSDFGFRTNSPNGARFHPAIDIGCPSGTPVYATADGVVVTVANETRPGGAGNYISIKHDNGLITQYLHLDRVFVSKGDNVTACQQIANSGNSGQSVGGNAYAAHLDYRIRFDSNANKYVDILCPCKTSDRNTQNSYNTNLNMTCAHSLFNASYKFKNSGAKHANWRVEHGHCMQNINSLLPDEVSQ